MTAHPGFEQRVRDSFALQRAMALIGATLARVAPGEVDVELPVRPDLTQQHGYVHAGILAAVLDSACGYAAFTLMPPDRTVVSVEFKINLLAPAVGDRIVARARVKKAGRTLSVCDADAVAFRNGQEKLVASMNGTMMSVPAQAAGRP